MATTDLSITPVKPNDIPSETALLAAAQLLIDAIPTWKPGKTYHKVVKTFTSPHAEGSAWHCRISEHPQSEATFDDLWNKLGVDKATNEMGFIPDIKKVTKIKEISPTASIWSMFYKFGFPLSPRVFTALQVTHLSDISPRTGIIVSIPIDLSSDVDLAKLEEKGIKGRYVGVERIMELEDGNTQWLMATLSTPGGLIPSFIVETSMNSTISDDVPHFLKWLQKEKATASSAGSA